MTTLVIYAPDYDGENENGFHGECFLDTDGSGLSFVSLSEAMAFIHDNDVGVNKVTICFRHKNDPNDHYWKSWGTVD